MLGNWIRQTTTTTGTGDLTLSAVTGYPTFNDVFGNGASYSPPFYYAILNDSDGTPIEEGIGRMSSSTNMKREKVLSTYVIGTLDQTSPAAATLAAGTKRVICPMTAHAAGSPAIPQLFSLYADRHVCSSHMVGNAQDTQAIGSGRMYAYPFLLSFGGEVDALAVEVSVAGGAGKKVNVGLFNLLKTGEGGGLVVESGELAIDSTGYKVGTFAARRLPPGWYAVCIQANDTATFRASSNATCLPSPFGTIGFSNNAACYVTRTYTTTQPSEIDSLSGSWTSGYDTNSRQIAIALRAV